VWCWRIKETIKWSDKVTNEQVLERVGEKCTFLNNILHRKANWVGQILRRNSFFIILLKDKIEVKGIGKRRTRLLDDFVKQKLLEAKGGS
jgi:hypothetical protein